MAYKICRHLVVIRENFKSIAHVERWGRISIYGATTKTYKHTLILSDSSENIKPISKEGGQPAYFYFVLFFFSRLFLELLRVTYVRIYLETVSHFRLEYNSCKRFGIALKKSVFL